MKELGRVVFNVCNVVPAGVVCFFPSYDYEAKVLSFWESTGFIEKIQVKKKVEKFVAFKKLIFNLWFLC